MKKLLLVCLVLGFACPVSAQQGFSSLEEQMTGQEFEAAGLEKLTAAELASLNGWIRKRSLATLDSPKATAASSQGSKQDIKTMERAEFSSRLVGSFSGWDGQTVFKLENGQIWAQADKDKYYVKAEESPMVTIKPAMFKGWRLSVEGHDEECKVKRIQ